MEKSVKINERCFVRNQMCGRAFGGSRICFLACPSSNEISLEIEAIKSVLRDNNIEPYVAVENFEPGKDIFCEKICGKIIEAQFCVVLLSDIRPIGKDYVIPNPNVYYEYGLMVAMHKTIVPLKTAGAPLVFNIQSLDTLTYNPKSLRGVLQTALKSALSMAGSGTDTVREYNYLNLYKKISQIENMPVFDRINLPEPWKSILDNTLFELKQGQLFVGDFTNAYVVDTIISEVIILLNHIRNEILSLKERIEKAPEDPTTSLTVSTAYQYQISGTPAIYWPTSVETKMELTSKLETIQATSLLLIIPDKWKKEVGKAYASITHPNKPVLKVTEQQEIMIQSMKAGLIPKQT